MAGISMERRELRVLQVFSALGVGGAETWLIALLRHIRENEDALPYRLKVDVLLTSGQRATLDSEASSLGAELFYFQYARSRLAEFAREFRALLRHGRYDALHDHQEHSAGLHFLLAAGTLPEVRAVHFHNPPAMRSRDYGGLGGKLVTTAGYFLAKRFATHMLGTSLQNLVEQGVDRPNLPADVYSGVLHCGFDTRHFMGSRPGIRDDVRRELSLDAQSTILLFVGRLHTDPQLDQKNPGFALEVAVQAMRANPRIQMVFAGAGAGGEKDLRDRAAAHGLSDRFRFIGLRTDIPRLMLGSDVLLFPSFAEGLGMVAVEAQAAGLRVLASDVVPRECVVVPDLVNFLPLSVGPAPWAAVVGELLAKPVPDLADANRAVHESDFSIERSTARLLEIYAGN